jgi:DMSO/TMAO reductase YedYZ molybdopterin-dependent catalytic subunit
MSLSRRKLILSGIGAVAGGAGITATARFAARCGLVPPDHGGIFGIGETLTYASQRLVTARQSLAREFDRSQITTDPPVNGRPPRTDDFRRLLAGDFADWRLTIEGMVARPAAFSLDDLKRLPSRSQITHIACEEGWSYIAEWTGAPLADVLEQAGMLPEARYVVYHSMDPFWWDSIDLGDALHAQTLLAYGMNGETLPVGHGAPLRMRVARQLGYKNVKHLARLTVTDDLKKFGSGKGSSAPDAGYSWYAGI